MYLRILNFLLSVLDLCPKSMRLLLSYLFLHLRLLDLLLLLVVLTGLFVFLELSLKYSEFLLFLSEDSLRLLLDLSLSFDIHFLLDWLFFEIKLVLSKVPVNFPLIYFFSRLRIRDHRQEHVISPYRYSIHVVNLCFLRETFSVQVNITILAVVSQWFNKILVLLLCYNGMICANTHTSDLNIICWLDSSFTNFSLLFVDGVVYPSTQLWIFV